MSHLEIEGPLRGTARSQLKDCLVLLDPVQRILAGFPVPTARVNFDSHGWEFLADRLILAQRRGRQRRFRFEQLDLNKISVLCAKSKLLQRSAVANQDRSYGVAFESRNFERDRILCRKEEAVLLGVCKPR